MKHTPAEILREYGPFPESRACIGVSFDGQRVWFASGDRLNALDPESGEIVGALDVAGDAGTAFDGTHLFQIAEAVIRKIDPGTGEVLGDDPGARRRRGFGARLGRGNALGRPAPWPQDPSGRSGDRGRAPHHRVDRFVTGVTWVDGELWHGTWEDDESDVRRIDPETGEVLERLEMPAGTGVSGLESDGGDRFFCGGGSSGKVRAIRRPRAKSVPVES